MNKKNVVANRYEVVQHIGQGGMADVFLAIDTILNRHVAIKFCALIKVQMRLVSCVLNVKHKLPLH